MDEQNAGAGFRFPRLTLAWTILAVIAIAVVSFGPVANWLNENGGQQPGTLNLIKVLLIFLTGVAWLIWLTFFSRLKSRIYFAVIFIAAIAAFFYQFRIVFDGDLGFVRIESRFVERQFETVRSKSGIDLTLTSSKDFPQFLGPDRDATVRNRVLNANWTANPPKIIWKKTIGEGWSGFSAVNGFAVTQEQRGQEECVTCYDVSSGELLWIHTDARRHEDTFSMGKAGPRATPTIVDGRVYTQGATGLLNCLDGSDGSLIWSVDVADLLGTDLEVKTSTRGLKYEYEKSSLSWGRSGSPLVFGDKVIVTGGLQSDKMYSTLIAFDKSNGNELWRGGNVMIAYGSPAIANLLGSKQITIVAESMALGLNPQNGDVFWQTAWPGHSDGDANCSQVTRLADDKILLSKAYKEGGELLKLSSTADGVSVESVWKNARVLRTKMMSPVIFEGHAYYLSDGFMECCTIDDESEGRRRWRKRDRFGNGQLLLVGKHLLVHTEDGRLKLVEASPEAYNELGEISTIDGVCWNTICLYDNFLLVRSELEAACIELKTEVQTSVAASADPSVPNDSPDYETTESNETDANE